MKAVYETWLVFCSVLFFLLNPFAIPGEKCEKSANILAQGKLLWFLRIYMHIFLRLLLSFVLCSIRTGVNRISFIGFIFKHHHSILVRKYILIITSILHKWNWLWYRSKSVRAQHIHTKHIHPFNTSNHLILSTKQKKH